MWRVIYFMRYRWFVNYLCLVVKISFPWGFSDNDWFKTWRVNFVQICAWNGITIPPFASLSLFQLLGCHCSKPTGKRFRKLTFLLKCNALVTLTSSSVLVTITKKCQLLKHLLFGSQRSQKNLPHKGIRLAPCCTAYLILLLSVFVAVTLVNNKIHRRTNTEVTFHVSEPIQHIRILRWKKDKINTISTQRAP